MRRGGHSLGKILRTLRYRSRTSLRGLAAKVDFSPSFLSQVENDQVSPSLSSLERLAAGLGGWSRARIEALGPVGAPHRLEAMMVTIRPGGVSGKRAHALPVERFAMVFEGTIRLTLGEEERVLRRGDAATIDAEMPHRWENRSRRSASLVIVTSRLLP
jgi:XRE family transcriptional regulator, regulator of sulfur utilization